MWRCYLLREALSIWTREGSRDDWVVGRRKLPVFVVDWRAVFGQFQPVVRALHGIEGSPFRE